MTCNRLPIVFHLHTLHQVTLGVGRITILKTKTACQHITKSPVHFTTISQLPYLFIGTPRIC